MSLDFIPFEEIGGLAVAALVVVYFMAFFIRGVIGFGSAMPAILGSAWILPPHEAVLIALLTSVFAQVQLLPQGFRDANWKITKPLIAGTILSVAVGVWIFASLKSAWLTIVLGLILSAAVLIDMTRLTQRMASVLQLDRFSVAFSLASIAGLMAGVAGAGANYFLSVYIRWAAPEPRAFRATNIVTSGAMTLWRALVILFAGLLSIKLAVESLLIMPAVYAGAWAGRKTSERMSAERYFGLFRWVLLAAAVALIWKGVTALE